MAIVVVTGDRYTVESVYQWDSNQVLEIRGLSLPSTPEIHYTNDGMQGALVKQAKMDSAGVITADIPNTLLQKTSRILAYVCVEQGKTFETLYKIEIPVKPRSKPSDYTFEDTDGEIYSYNALENKVNDALNTLTNDYGKASDNLTDAKTKYNAAAASLDSATQANNNAADLYAAALETLNGVEDGNVFVKKAGDVMSGALDMNGNAIENVPDPVNDGDAVNKRYLTPVLLWENPNPTAAFGSTTVDIDLTDAHLICVDFDVGNGGGNIDYITNVITWVHPLACYRVIDDSNAMISELNYRNFTILGNLTGITFDSGQKTYLGSSSVGGYDSICIPLRVYKIL